MTVNNIKEHYYFIFFVLSSINGNKNGYGAI